ncbi:MAG TPA: S53 family peptidase [Planktothrix sp.]|jgi:kumamolisin
MKLTTVLKKSIVGLTAALLMAALCSWLYDLSVGAIPRTTVLDGNTPSVLYQAQYVGRSQPQQTLQVVVGLKLRNGAALDALIAQQSDPNSPQFRHYLTPQQFMQQFGPTQVDVDTAVQYFTSQGLKVVQVAPNNVVIELEGTTAQVEKAFNVHLNRYSLQGVASLPNGMYMSNNQDPSVPSSLADIVQSVSGLNDFSQLHSRMLKSGKQPAKPNVPEGYTPQDIAGAYNFPNANNWQSSVKYSGKGHTVAIATVYGYLQSDVDGYWKQFGVARTGTITNVPINGKTKKIDGESTLDLETVGAQAPGADIRMYIGSNPAFKTFTLIFNQIVVDDKADVVSVSWGSCESHTGTAQIQTESSIFKQAAAQGIAVFSSSGDDGAYDCAEKKNPRYAVDYPSSDVNVTAVGGTQLWLLGTFRLFESAWSDSGGGTSTTFARPAWQSGAGVTAGAMRNTADVSMDADPETGYAFFSNGKWVQLGGTSVSTPDWASLWILAVDATGSRMGPANPSIYRIANSADYAKVFIDITRGDNGRSAKDPGFNAGLGYDNPTGWGVPNGTALVQWLMQWQRAVPAPTGQAPLTAGTDKSPAKPLPPQVIGPDLHDGKAKPR